MPVSVMMWRGMWALTCFIEQAVTHIREACPITCRCHFFETLVHSDFQRNNCELYSIMLTNNPPPSESPPVKLLDQLRQHKRYSIRTEDADVSWVAYFVPSVCVVRWPALRRPPICRQANRFDSRSTNKNARLRGHLVCWRSGRDSNPRPPT